MYPTTAGAAHDVTVTAKDGYGNTDTAYAGTVAITSSDGAAVLPASSTLPAGTKTFSVTLKTAGEQSITATDTVTASITGTQSDITVVAATATHLDGGGFTDPTTAGAARKPTAACKNSYGNTDTAYAGTGAITRSDGAAVL